jgi:hypothetical protein
LTTDTFYTDVSEASLRLPAITGRVLNAQHQRGDAGEGALDAGDEPGSGDAGEMSRVRNRERAAFNETLLTREGLE